MKYMIYKKNLKYGIFLMLIFVVFAVALPMNVSAEDDPDFGIVIYPSSQTVAPGELTTFVITLTSLNGFNSPVTLSISGLPDGANAYFNPNSVTPTDNSILKIVASEETETGDFPITLTATGEGITHTIATAITVEFGLIPMKFGTFTGQVTDIVTDEPISGATVFIYSQYTYFIQADDRYWPSNIEVTTDPDGYYTITGVPLEDTNAPKDWVVGFHADGYSGTYHVATAIADTIITVDMAMCPGSSITGRVTNVDDGSPIPGVSVTALSTISGSYARATQFFTDDDGYYTLPDLPLREDNADRIYSVGVSPPGYCCGELQATISCGSSVELDFSLIPKLYGTFTGTVTDAEGNPIIGAKVYIHDYHSYQVNPDYNTWQKTMEVTTDPNGQYIINNVPLVPCNNPKDWVICFYADGYSGTYHVATAIAETVVTVDITLCDPASITGRVIDANTGNPVIGAKMEANSMMFGSHYSHVRAYNFYTDNDGYYTLPNLPLGEDNADRTYTIGVSHPEYYDPYEQVVTISCGISSESYFSMIPKLYGTFTGRVTDAEIDAPIAGATVFINPPPYLTYNKYPTYSTWSKTIDVTTDYDGYYTMTDIPLDPINVPKNYIIGFYADGYSSTYLGTTAVAGTVVTVDMALCHASITGRVADASSGEPIAGASFLAWSYLSSDSPFYIYSQVWIREFTTDDDGYYTLPNLPLGYDKEPRLYNIRVTAEGYWPQIKTGTIFCGGDITIDFAGPDIAFGTITGTVTDCITELPIAVAFIGSNYGGVTYTDEDGSYTLTDVPLEPDGSPKTWDVTAQAEGYVSLTDSVQAIADEVSILDFTLCQPNLPPVADANGPYEGYEGSPITFDASLSGDPDGDSLQYRWDFENNGEWDIEWSDSPYAEHTWFDDYSGTVAVEVFDGMYTDIDTATVTVYNVAPTPGAGEDKIGDEPSTFTFIGTHTDPGTLDTHTYEWDFDYDGTTFDADATGNGVTNTWCDDFDGTVALRVTDDDGGWDIDTCSVFVNNVAPDITTLTVTPGLVEIDETVTLDATFTDPGCDTWTAYIDWDYDGTYDDTISSVTSPISITHYYTETGVYTVKLKVEDDDDGFDTEIFRYVVVYDPNDGFVTGGGWIDSPEGAYTPDPDLTGKATFGFVSKYQKGKQTPTGNTEFQFHAADMNFHSNEYEWLVVTHHKAIFKGNGTINGDGNYGFMLSAIDEALTESTDVDLFRIKIWDKDNNDEVIYDNMLDEDEDADPTTAITNGQIVIHKT